MKHNILPPLRVFIGAGPPCDTCVIILAGPPAVAMTYVNPSRGLEPSLYGGGGSPSSRSLLLEPYLSLVSRGSAALVSATAAATADEEGSSAADEVAEKAGRGSDGASGSATDEALFGSSVVASVEEVEGGK